MKKVVEITTPTCSVCKMLKPMIEMVMNKNFSSNEHNIKLDVRDHEDPEVKHLINQYSIHSVPAFFFMDNDKVKNTHFGAISAPEFKKLCETLFND